MNCLWNGSLNEDMMANATKDENSGGGRQEVLQYIYHNDRALERHGMWDEPPGLSPCRNSLSFSESAAPRGSKATMARQTTWTDSVSKTKTPPTADGSHARVS